MKRYVFELTYDDGSTQEIGVYGETELNAFLSIAKCLKMDYVKSVEVVGEHAC